MIWCERLNVPDYLTSSFVPGLCLITIRGLFWRHNYPWHVRLTAGYYVGVLLHVLVVHLAIVLAHLSAGMTWGPMYLGLVGLLMETRMSFSMKRLENLMGYGSILHRSSLCTFEAVVLLAPAQC